MYVATGDAELAYAIHIPSEEDAALHCVIAQVMLFGLECTKHAAARHVRYRWHSRIVSLW